MISTASNDEIKKQPKCRRCLIKDADSSFLKDSLGRDSIVELDCCSTCKRDLLVMKKAITGEGIDWFVTEIQQKFYPFEKRRR